MRHHSFLDRVHLRRNISEVISKIHCHGGSITGSVYGFICSSVDVERKPAEE